MEVGIDSYLALNCSLITNTTNKNIGRKDPLTYLKERYEWTNEEIVNQRLKSHLISVQELSNGGYEGLEEEAKREKIKTDFESFITSKAILIYTAAKELCQGKTVSYGDIYEIVKKQKLIQDLN